MADSSVSTIVPTTFTNLDGLARDRSGYIYVSSVGNGIVVRYDPDFSRGPETVSTGHAAPADIFINNESNVLAIPNLGADRVDFKPISPPTSVRKTGSSLPSDFKLLQNYPNPFNPATRIEFQLASASNVTLSIYDITGRSVRTLLAGTQNAGHTAIVWDGTNDRGRRASSGVYLYKLSASPISGAGGAVLVQSRKMVLLK